MVLVLCYYVGRSPGLPGAGGGAAARPGGWWTRPAPDQCTVQYSTVQYSTVQRSLQYLVGEGGGGRGGGGGPRRGHHGVPVGDVEQVGVLAAPCTCTWVVPGTGVVLLAGRCHHAAVEGVEGGLVEVV